MRVSYRPFARAVVAALLAAATSGCVMDYSYSEVRSTDAGIARKLDRVLSKITPSCSPNKRALDLSVEADSEVWYDPRWNEVQQEHSIRRSSKCR